MLSFLKFPKKFKWPSKKQWSQIFKILSQKEKIALFGCLAAFLASSISLAAIVYFKNTEKTPRVGGEFTERVVGSPRFINPIYSANSDTDRDLVEIIFSGLMKYGESGQIIPDLAKDVEINQEDRIYEVYLKDNIFWHDQKPLTADDVIFTIKTIQNSDYKSPLRANYLGVEVEKIDEKAVRFKLKSAYSGFLERLTLQIMPKHIWENILPQNFILTHYNLKPIGSGPYQFEKLKQDKSGSITSLELTRFKNYYDNPKPYLSKIVFRFFENEGKLLDSMKKEKESFREISLSLPRYFAVFFNSDKSSFLADKNIREALSYGTNKQELIEGVFAGKAKVIESPMLPEIYGLKTPSKVLEFNQETAQNLFLKAGLEKKDNNLVKITKEQSVEFKSELKVGSQGPEVTMLQTCLGSEVTGYFGSKTREAVINFQEKYSDVILKPSGYARGTGSVGKATRAKLNEICSKLPKETKLRFLLATSQDPSLRMIAENLQKQWQAIGVEIEIQTYPISKLEQEIIKPRNYEMLLFGQVLGAVPDPFPFWHSSQRKDPGLNLANYKNDRADKLLEKARITMDAQARIKNYESFQDILVEDVPSLFLASPEYPYLISKEIQGISTKMIVDPSKRFSDIENWFVKTKRTWK